MRVWEVSACVLATFVIASCSAEAKQLCGQEVVAVDAMTASIKAQSGAAVTRETSAIVEIADEKQLILWTIVKPQSGQPAAVICRKIVQDDGRVSVNLSAECIGTTPGCDGVISRVLEQQSRATAPLRQR